MKCSRLALALAILSVSLAARSAEPRSESERIIDAWGSIKLKSQKLDVALSARSAKLSGRFELEALKDASKAVFPFALPGGNEGDAATVTCDGKQLPAIPHLMPKLRPKDKRSPRDIPFPWKRHRRDAAALRRAQELRNALQTWFGILHGVGMGSPYRWQAHDIAMPKGRKSTITANAALRPMQLADHAKHGPCYAFRIPIRLGRLWARPAGKLNVTVSLDKDVDPEDVILVRPSQTKRDGRKIALSFDGQLPAEDLIVVLKGKLPKEEKAMEVEPRAKKHLRK